MGLRLTERTALIVASLDKMTAQKRGITAGDIPKHYESIILLGRDGHPSKMVRSS